MGTDRRAAEWYRSRIHRQQKHANSLSIEVGLRAQDGEDTALLAETMGCLERAIAILEEARARLDAAPAHPA